MFINNYKLSPIVPYWRRIQPYLPRIVAVLLGVYLLNYAAILTWKLVPVKHRAPLTLVSAGTMNIAAKPGQINLQPLLQLQLFGQAGKKTSNTAAPLENAPPTTLNLTLTGVVASSAEKQGAAIIQKDGKQQTYGIGDKIDGTQVTVEHVFADRVTLNNGGRNETLMLDGFDYHAKPLVVHNQPVHHNGRASGPESVEHRTLSPSALQIRDKISNEPASFSEFIGIAPAIKDGRTVGYSVRPGRSPELFNNAGLKAGDILTELNGMDLTDPQQAMEAMRALNDASSLQLTIDRNGETMTLLLDLPDGNN